VGAIPDNAEMKVILFDIDGTLISTGGAGKAALEMALSREFGIGTPIEKLSLSGRTDRAILRDLFGLYQLDESPITWQRLREGYLRHLPECLARVTGRVLPGVAALLDQLRDREDVAVGLLTGNMRAGARLKLGHYDLHEHFEFGGYGDEHLDRNDVAREAWAEVQLRFNECVRAEDVWVIGDTPLDVRCARAIGAKAVAVTTGWHSREELAASGPDLLLTDLSDPLPLLEKR
jgi:phosphoglycolate phosphatase-like HAD superfamily hydrolase